ncbi:MAG TPA: dihydrofolate reductase [Casimicrobiaceae bacterium]|nr:dihydrofolate reductase [Casimicrobiaceae bacterium]
MRPALALIVAVAANGVIGRDGKLPWHLPADLRHFRALTTGHSIIMGRRTWQSLPRALPDRQNIVVSRQTDFTAAGALVVRSLNDALGAVDRPEPAFCIGGGELYRAALPLSRVAYVTEVAGEYSGDATFPKLDAAHWREASRESHVADDTGVIDYAFVTYERRAAAY